MMWDWRKKPQSKRNINPFPFVLLSRLTLGLPPIGKASACFWVLPRYQKTVDTPEHRRGNGRETNREDTYVVDIHCLYVENLFLKLNSPARRLTLLRLKFVMVDLSSCTGYNSDTYGY